MKKFVFIVFLSFGWINCAFSGDGIGSGDSLRSYYQKYFNDPLDSIVLTAADTLFDMAQKSNDLLMMKMALAGKMDFYFYGDGEHNIDSVLVWTDRIKAHAKATNDSELYYWIWSSRLIFYYLKIGEYNIALVEAEKMLAEAEKSTYKESLAECYSALNHIYNAKGLKKKSQEFMLKEIELVESNNLNRFHITFQYSDAAGIYIEEGETDKALPLLDKALKYIHNSYHEVTVKLEYVNYYLAKNDIQAAKKMLEECRMIYEKEPSAKLHIHYYYDVEADYYYKIKAYNEALASIELRKKELEKINDVGALLELDKKKANILWDANRKLEAGELYRTYLVAQEKEKEKNEEITTGEFATLLNMQKLSMEKQQLEETARKKQLENVRLIVILLSVLLFVLAFFLYQQRKLNRELNHSRNELDKKNRILMDAEIELRKAKELAEDSSQMKTVFIQNMSHEIRTPLNSIVGFSAVLADLFSGEENEDIMQYASLIETNSQLLLNLINDILEISDLDNDAEITTDSTDVNNCCLMAIEEVKPLLKKEVELVFEPGTESLLIESNSVRITQVLKNLLNNAAKFTFAGTITLTYSLKEFDKQLLFTVTDTGIGITPGEEEHIFERFIKLDEFTQGGGLGLSISRLIAEKMGGYLVVDKEYKHGAKFVFCIAVGGH